MHLTNIDMSCIIYSSLGGIIFPEVLVSADKLTTLIIKSLGETKVIDWLPIWPNNLDLVHTHLSSSETLVGIRLRS